MPMLTGVMSILRFMNYRRMCWLSFVQIVRLLDKTQAVLWKMIKKINFALGAVLC